MNCDETTGADSFFQSVYTIVRMVPAGKVISYGQIAWMLGFPNGGRQVGWAMRFCPDDAPWQRVVKADGSISGGMEPEIRRAMLESEGVPFLPNGRVDMRRCRWSGSEDQGSGMSCTLIHDDAK